ncbi:hypothetical protein FQR65_LT20272 [Abscondita terminalis]|nr:hypothetical protein FQR65_LT20272 [Abscondita terminalis]
MDVARLLEAHHDYFTPTQGTDPAQRQPEGAPIGDVLVPYRSHRFRLAARKRRQRLAAASEACSSRREEARGAMAGRSDAKEEISTRARAAVNIAQADYEQSAIGELEVAQLNLRRATLHSPVRRVRDPSALPPRRLRVDRRRRPAMSHRQDHRVSLARLAIVGGALTLPVAQLDRIAPPPMLTHPQQWKRGEARTLVDPDIRRTALGGWAFGDAQLGPFWWRAAIAA